MAFNPSKEVAAARDFAKKFNKRQVVIIYVDDEKFGYSSYGATKAECNKARKLADELYCSTEEYLQKINS